MKKLIFLLFLLLVACAPKQYGELVVVNLVGDSQIAIIRTPDRDIALPTPLLYGQKTSVKLPPGLYKALSATDKDYVILDRKENVYIEAGGVYTWNVGGDGSFLLYYHPEVPCRGEMDIGRGYFVSKPVGGVREEIVGRLKATGLRPLGLDFVEMGENKTFVFVVYRTDGKTPLVWPEGELVSELLVCSGVGEGELLERGWVKVGEGFFIGGKAEAKLEGGRLMAEYRY
jgi:hypothetical protein